MRRCARTLNKHAGSGLAGSTFRRGLTALLWQGKGWTPLLTNAGGWRLTPEDDAALTAWQAANLRLSWVHVARPWDIEAFTIRELEPPFNLRDNYDHPFYEDMETARALFKARAEALARE